MSDPQPVDGPAIVREFVRHSPFAALLGLELVRVEADAAELRMPFDPKLATQGDVVHGGAIGALIDTAATAAAWAAEFERMPARWGTASLTVNYERPASATDLVATARVARRGRNLCFCEVVVSAGSARVASGSAVYTLAT